MNDGDLAAQEQEQYDAQRDERIAAIREKMRSPSLTHCEDCDAPIPEARRALGGVTRCVECAEIEERRRG